MAPPRPFRVFYCWQSDTKAAANRTLIGDALERAVATLGREAGIEVAHVDRDTQGVPGAPEIASTIFEKLRCADAIVADLTLVTPGTEGRRMPNPNVLVEVGYVLGAVGPNKLVGVLYTAVGGPEELPFDIRRRRVATYESPEDVPERAHARRKLEGQLVDALREIIKENAAERERLGPAVTMSVSHRRIAVPHGEPAGERHDYELVVELNNRGTRIINSWRLDIDLPTPLRVPNEGHAAIVSRRSDARLTRFQFGHPGREALSPGDPVSLTVPYVVTRDVYERHRDILVDGAVRVRLAVDDEIMFDERHPMAALQNF